MGVKRRKMEGERKKNEMKISIAGEMIAKLRRGN